MAENLIGSEIIKLAGEVKAKMEQGEKIYNLTIGDFNPKLFSIPSELKEEIIKAYNNDETNYPAANGIQELREAVSRFLHTREGLEYPASQILISGGARPLIYAVYQTLIDPQDKVLFPVPSWNNNHYTHLSHGQQIIIQTTAENKFMPTAADIKPHISEANLVAVCSPLNPTGTTFTEQGLKEICDLIIEENKKRGSSRKPVYLLYDQIYWTLTHGDTFHVDPVTLCPDIKNYTIYIDGISKAFAATGVRVGWAFGPQKIIDKMKSILSHVGAWSPKAEQVATANYLNNDNAIDTYLASFKRDISKRLDAFYEGMIKLKSEGFDVDAIAPEAAIYLTVNFNLVGKKTEDGSVLETTADVTRYLLEEAKLAIVPFNAFGADKDSTWYRLSVGTSVYEEITTLFEQLKAALSKLN
ncbi:aminotransferase class I/II-fold pyridoxal phosphate-dependent enzyme [Vicingus serpentipes]|uniref:Aminotransferase class I/II-fold pyridoxal phosphate-dependent enzyme n=2 Tax=Vicingus serpentipes TaxID=1926625 RepID=A0A5C6RNS0_9FLAO|nr:aminotransferase class I/II-fold pyridoxal phosphate-dependent enzyme [Vicingus serpentipes]